MRERTYEHMKAVPSLLVCLPLSLVFVFASSQRRREERTAASARLHALPSREGADERREEQRSERERHSKLLRGPLGFCVSPLPSSSRGFASSSSSGSEASCSRSRCSPSCPPASLSSTLVPLCLQPTAFPVQAVTPFERSSLLAVGGDATIAVLAVERTKPARVMREAARKGKREKREVNKERACEQETGRLTKTASDKKAEHEEQEPEATTALQESTGYGRVTECAKTTDVAKEAFGFPGSKDIDEGDCGACRLPEWRLRTVATFTVGDASDSRVTGLSVSEPSGLLTATFAAKTGGGGRMLLFRWSAESQQLLCVASGADEEDRAFCAGTALEVAGIPRFPLALTADGKHVYATKLDSDLASLATHSEAVLPSPCVSAISPAPAFFSPAAFSPSSMCLASSSSSRISTSSTMHASRSRPPQNVGALANNSPASANLCERRPSRSRAELSPEPPKTPSSGTKPSWEGRHETVDAIDEERGETAVDEDSEKDAVDHEEDDAGAGRAPAGEESLHDEANVVTLYERQPAASTALLPGLDGSLTAVFCAPAMPVHVRRSSASSLFASAFSPDAFDASVSTPGLRGGVARAATDADERLVLEGRDKTQRKLERRADEADEADEANEGGTKEGEQKDNMTVQTVDASSSVGSLVAFGDMFASRFRSRAAEICADLSIFLRLLRSGLPCPLCVSSLPSRPVSSAISASFSCPSPFSASLSSCVPSSSFWPFRSTFRPEFLFASSLTQQQLLWLLWERFVFFRLLPVYRHPARVAGRLARRSRRLQRTVDSAISRASRALASAMEAAQIASAEAARNASSEKQWRSKDATERTTGRRGEDENRGEKAEKSGRRRGEEAGETPTKSERARNSERMHIQDSERQSQVPSLPTVNAALDDLALKWTKGISYFVSSKETAAAFDSPPTCASPASSSASSSSSVLCSSSFQDMSDCLKWIDTGAASAAQLLHALPSLQDVEAGEALDTTEERERAGGSIFRHSQRWWSGERTVGRASPSSLTGSVEALTDGLVAFVDSLRAVRASLHKWMACRHQEEQWRQLAERMHLKKVALLDTSSSPRDLSVLPAPRAPGAATVSALSCSHVTQQMSQIQDDKPERRSPDPSSAALPFSCPSSSASASPSSAISSSSPSPPSCVSSSSFPSSSSLPLPASTTPAQSTLLADLRASALQAVSALRAKLASVEEGKETRHEGAAERKESGREDALSHERCETREVERETNIGLQGHLTMDSSGQAEAEQEKAEATDREETQTQDTGREKEKEASSEDDSHRRQAEQQLGKGDPKGRRNEAPGAQASENVNRVRRRLLALLEEIENDEKATAPHGGNAGVYVHPIGEVVGHQPALFPGGVGGGNSARERSEREEPSGYLTETKSAVARAERGEGGEAMGNFASQDVSEGLAEGDVNFQHGRLRRLQRQLTTARLLLAELGRAEREANAEESATRTKDDTRERTEAKGAKNLEKRDEFTGGTYAEESEQAGRRADEDVLLAHEECGEDRSCTRREAMRERAHEPERNRERGPIKKGGGIETQTGRKGDFSDLDEGLELESVWSLSSFSSLKTATDEEEDMKERTARLSPASGVCALSSASSSCSLSRTGASLQGACVKVTEAGSARDATNRTGLSLLEAETARQVKAVVDCMREVSGLLRGGERPLLFPVSSLACASTSPSRISRKDARSDSLPSLLCRLSAASARGVSTSSCASSASPRGASSSPQRGACGRRRESKGSSREWVAWNGARDGGGAFEPLWATRADVRLHESQATLRRLREGQVLLAEAAVARGGSPLFWFVVSSLAFAANSPEALSALKREVFVAGGGAERCGGGSSAPACPLCRGRVSQEAEAEGRERDRLEKNRSAERSGDRARELRGLTDGGVLAGSMRDAERARKRLERVEGSWRGCGDGMRRRIEKQRERRDREARGAATVCDPRGDALGVCSGRPSRGATLLRMSRGTARRARLREAEEAGESHGDAQPEEGSSTSEESWTEQDAWDLFWGVEEVDAEELGERENRAGESERRKGRRARRRGETKQERRNSRDRREARDRWEGEGRRARRAGREEGRGGCLVSGRKGESLRGSEVLREKSEKRQRRQSTHEERRSPSVSPAHVETEEEEQSGAQVCVDLDLVSSLASLSVEAERELEELLPLLPSCPGSVEECLAAVRAVALVSPF
ncbi:hypothetical protein TGARI_271145B [Toxoplasma gondii ARI]|uniref:Uncharacterized protein n=3 Tax=Toxoplasma gondii TaxID=5811 RepID=A0A139Y6U8_TOXGO|nr:hypothetical protein TGARI_271145B [Toxoplasma gondii ARI]